MVVNYVMPWEESFFIDDASREIDLMKKRCPWVTAIQMREPPPWEKQKVSQYKDVHLSTLAEAPLYIQNKFAE